MKFLSLILFVLSFMPCISHSEELDMQGNDITNVSTFTFKYKNIYTTMSAKLDEIAISTTHLKLHANNTNYVTLNTPQTISGSKVFMATQTFQNSIAVTTITYSDGSIQASNTYYYQTSEAQSDTTSTSFQDKLVSSVTLTNGLYYLGWTAEIKNDTVGKATEVQLFESVYKSTYNVSNFYQQNAIFWSTQSGFSVVTSTGSQYRFRVQFRQQLGGTAQIRRARLWLKRVF